MLFSFQYQPEELQRETLTQPMHLSVNVPWMVLPWYTMAAVRPQKGFPFDCKPIISTDCNVSGFPQVLTGRWGKHGGGDRNWGAHREQAQKSPRTLYRWTSHKHPIPLRSLYEFGVSRSLLSSNFIRETGPRSFLLLRRGLTTQDAVRVREKWLEKHYSQVTLVA